MCQIESVFHHACAHWAARPRFVGEPCVRARHVAVSPQPTTSTETTHNNTTVTIIPCDYPDHLGAADEAGECAECARHRRRCPVFVFGTEEVVVQGYDGSEEDGEGAERRSSVDSDMTMSSSSSSSSSSTSYGCSDGDSGSKRSWRPFAGLSEGAWEELKRVQARRERKIRGVGGIVGVLAEEEVVVVVVG
ncbi:uncharacterized protein LTHEOB_2691 [Lasiodiplodia theobromae]|uniref:uncharacterized protein n=1 Tax=Lasiodiplodia theobromae TaxID=45133 RepID=UPI0015C3148C|nr:uncharacterized protein LTHEOB_2691 [Lasiodiplodia theobromae]KAF4534716.1 hypothetical protein LTHEOB_2691 [Lasiodiplodia theobromae]